MNILLNDVANAALLFVNFHHQSLADILPRSPKLQRHQFYVLLMQYYLLRRLNSLLSLLSDYWEILSTLTFTSVTLTFTSIFSCSLNCFWLTLTLLFFFCLSFFPFNFWTMTSSLDPDAVSDTIVYTARSPTHFYVGFSLCPKHALAGFATYFAWDFKLSWSSCSLCFWTLEAHSLKLCSLPSSHTRALHHPAEWLPVHWVMQFMFCHLSPQAIHSPQLVLLLSFLCYHWWFFLPHTAIGLSWTGNGFLTAALLILAWWVSGVSVL